NSILNAMVRDAIVGGQQFYYDESTLNAKEAGAVSGGQQFFYNKSTLNANVSRAVDGGELFFGDDSVLMINTIKALTNKASVTFGEGEDVAAGTGTLDLNGHDTMIGRIKSDTEGAGTITNNGANRA